MKKRFLQFKPMRTAMFLAFLGFSLASYAQPSYVAVEFKSTTNAVDQEVSGSTNGVNTYKTFEITIPFFSSTLDQLTFKSNFPGQCPSGAMINVNGQSSTYAGDPNAALHKYFVINNLGLGTHDYTIKTLCNGMEIPNTRKLYRVTVVREPSPYLDISFHGKCQSKNGNYNGYVTLMANGTYTHGSGLYIKTTESSNTCADTAVKLTSMGSNGELTNSGFFQCNANSTYTVTMLYRKLNIRNNPVIKPIHDGQYGWNDFTYRKKGWTCIKKERGVLLPAFRAPDSTAGEELVTLNNPVQSELNLFVADGNDIVYDIEVFDFAGTSVKKSQLRNSNAGSLGSVDVGDLKKGIYIVEIKGGDTLIRKKMIKQ